MRCFAVMMVCLGIFPAPSQGQQVSRPVIDLVRKIHAQFESNQVQTVPRLIAQLATLNEPGLLPPIDDPDIRRSLDCWVNLFLCRYRELDAADYAEFEKTLTETVEPEFLIRRLPAGSIRGELMLRRATELQRMEQYQAAELLWLEIIHQPAGPESDQATRLRRRNHAALNLSGMWARLGLHYDAMRIADQFGVPQPRLSLRALPRFQLPTAFEWELEEHPTAAYNKDLLDFIYDGHVDPKTKGIFAGEKLIKGSPTDGSRPPHMGHRWEPLDWGLVLRPGHTRSLLVDRVAGRVSHRFEDSPFAEARVLSIDAVGYWRDSHLVFGNWKAGKPVVEALSMLQVSNRSRWEHRIPHPKDKQFSVRVAPPEWNVRFVALCTPDRVRLLDAVTGQCRWEWVTRTGPDQDISLGNDTVVVESPSGKGAISLRASTGRLLAKLVYPRRSDFDGANHAPPSLIGHHVEVQIQDRLGLTTIRRFNMNCANPETSSSDTHFDQRYAATKELVGQVVSGMGTERHVQLRDRRTDAVLKTLKAGKTENPTTCFADLANHYLWLGRLYAIGKDSREVREHGTLVALDRKTHQEKWRKQLPPFIDVTPLYPHLPFRVHVLLTGQEDDFHAPPVTNPRRYDVQLLSVADGRIAFERKAALEFVPELTYVDPETKTVHLLCPTEEAKITMQWPDERPAAKR